jgi:diacylglycerol O-acyltransferase
MTAGPTRMAGADAAWLHVDRPRNRMIVNTVLWTGRPVDWDAVCDRITGRVVPAAVRLRTRAVDPLVPLGLWGARWDPQPVDLDAHVVRARLDPPGDAGTLGAYIAAEAARALPPDRPLWCLHAIDGFGGGSAALLRTHHAMADGTAIMRLVDLLTEPGDDDDLAPEPEGAAPGAFAPGTWTDAGVLTKLVTARPNRTGPFGNPLSGTKAVEWTAAVPLAGLRGAGRDRDATVNDVALAAVAGGLRRYVADPGALDAEAVVPVNLRAPGEAVTTGLGNRFGLVFVPLPVDEPDVGRRIDRAKAAMDRIKGTHEAQMVYDAFTVLGRTTRTSARGWVDAFARRACVVVTNIRGPAAPVRLGGAPVQGLVLFVPSTGSVGVGISLCTYAGQARLGVISDDAVVPADDPIGPHLGAALAEAVSGGGAGVGGQSAEDLDDTVP